MKYAANGTAQIHDEWDFDWRLWDFILGRVGIGQGNGRTWFGQKRTVLGSTLPGTPFPVSSHDIKVTQTSDDLMLKFGD
jgi:hypothetical protein